MWIGRNWEGFAADPYVDGILGAQSIRGLQESVIASVKHFVANVSVRPNARLVHLLNDSRNKRRTATRSAKTTF